ncbi:TolB amino-terminal domain-containing protein [Bradyrhizobium sp. Rc2d]|uniref:winged helix-turn-helix domain-containing protein n=1 Tax=Bradyrhizobium sp. Rc2d TaxID=1855321 RepID=UPI00088A4D85|nr:winged helix-turn-helix domain-containing protein [Bradyrhizobium sp. Rc2d]SDK01466.1 TolB amino-terminal domain-containing protein [Bradyrhizobium sp. Rc2d]
MRYFFEDYLLDTELRELRRGPDVVHTSPQVLDLLEFLIRTRDRVVSKDDVISAIWNGRIVSDAALTTRLNAVRRAIGDSGERQRLIKTFPRKGFRFVGALHDADRRTAIAMVSSTEQLELAHPTGKEAVLVPASSQQLTGKRRSHHRLGHLKGPLKLAGAALASVAAVGAIAGGLSGYWSAWKTLRTDPVREAQEIQGVRKVIPEIKPRLSIVVLPFANLNNDPEQDQFADSITRELTIDLARTPATLVIGHETALIYKDRPIDLKQFGSVLGIRWAVQGAVRRNGDQVRINVSLTDLQTARDIWSDWFDGDLANLVTLHGNITARLLCVAHLHLRQYEQAIEQCSRSLNIGASHQAYVS